MAFPIGSLRLPFLVLTPVCVLLGVSTAVWSGHEINLFYLGLIMLAAVCAHISVNAFNEYFDFRSGLDFKTKRTSFSGGSGTLVEHPELAKQVLGIAILTLIVTCTIGLHFIYVNGLALLPLGMLGVLLITLYTSWITHHPILCLIAAGVGFGPLMVMGTDLILSGHYSWTAFVVSLVPFLLANNLLLLNQMPDIEADKVVGRRHIAIVMGTRFASHLFGISLLWVYLILCLSVYFDSLPVLVLMAMVTLMGALPLYLGVVRYANNAERLVPYMGLNVLITLLMPALMAVGLLLG